MYSYHLNKKKSQTFVKYYKEENDKINIYYGDGSILETDNTHQTKRNLNSIQEFHLCPSGFREPEHAKSL